MLIPIRKVVAQYLSSSDRSSHEFLRCYNIAVRGYQNEFNMDVQGNFKTVLLDVQPNRVVELPSDYINYSKIGIVNGGGEFVTLKRNDQLSNYHAVYYGQANRNRGVNSISAFGTDTDTIAYNTGYYYNFFNGDTSFNLYGADSGTATIGTYKVDVGEGIIILNPDFNFPQVLLEYLSDGYNEDDEDYMIDSRAAEAMLAWIRWQSSIDMPKRFSGSLVQMYKQEYFNEKRKAKNRMNPFNLAEMNDIIRRGTKLTPKS